MITEEALHLLAQGIGTLLEQKGAELYRESRLGGTLYSYYSAKRRIHTDLRAIVRRSGYPALDLFVDDVINRNGQYVDDGLAGTVRHALDHLGEGGYLIQVYQDIAQACRDAAESLKQGNSNPS